MIQYTEEQLQASLRDNPWGEVPLPRRPKYLSTKTYGTDRGLSCCFRQWRATHSHCSLLHGYSIGIKLIFESDTLDDKNWCMDFGGLKLFKDWADHMFDHTLVVAQDDPMLVQFEQLNQLGLADLRVVPGVGCEMFAKICYDKMSEILEILKSNTNDRYPVNMSVRVKSVEVFEHDANSAIYEG
jgi:6-pyruvoyltetrahydropterin/6-carboxytetrahydropterin synthase